MKSPFPGMDPYIESSGLWGDFHNDLVIEIKHALSRVAPERYFVRSGERLYHVFVESRGKRKHPLVPDVRITTRTNDKKPRKKSGSVAVAEPSAPGDPMVLRAFHSEEHRETFVEIYEDDPELRLVTTIEVLSPSNKHPGTEGWIQYHNKRQSALLGGVHLVEIDLLRGGRRPLMVDPWPDSPYTLLVGRADEQLHCRVWQAYFDRPLPVIPIPLTNPDADIMLDLQPLIDTIYDMSRYGRAIDYSKPLKPPLRGAEATWVKAQLRQWQRSR